MRSRAAAFLVLCLALETRSGALEGGPSPASAAPESPSAPQSPPSVSQPPPSAPQPSPSVAPPAESSGTPGSTTGPPASGGDNPGAQAPVPPPQPAQPAAPSAGPPAGGAAALPASSAGAERTRLEFMTAMQRVRLGLPDLEDSRAIKHYPIYSYLIAARLHRDLERAPQEQLDSAIDDFLKTHAGQPVVRSLRHAWLASL